MSRKTIDFLRRLGDLKNFHLLPLFHFTPFFMYAFFMQDAYVLHEDYVLHLGTHHMLITPHKNKQTHYTGTNTTYFIRQYLVTH